MLKSISMMLALSGAILLIGMFDVWTGEVGLSVFYLLPIGAAAWALGLRATLFTAVLASGCWFVADRWVRTDLALMLSVWNATSRLLIFSVMGGAIARLRKDREELEDLNRRLRAALTHEAAAARTDFLTRLPNSRALVEELGLRLGSARETGRPVAVAYVDLDNFKGVNDRYGHDRGDDVLQRVAEEIRACIRAGDDAFRVGGDEFVILLFGIDPDAAERVARRVCERVSMLERVVPDCGIGATVGVVWYPVPELEAREMIRLADDLMYRAKTEGKGTVRLEIRESHRG